MRKNCADALARWNAGTPSPASARGGSIWTDGETLWSYGTALAVNVAGLTVFNRTPYSRTTTTHQNALASVIAADIVTDAIPRGYGSERALTRLAEAEILAA